MSTRVLMVYCFIEPFLWFFIACFCVQILCVFFIYFNVFFVYVFSAFLFDYFQFLVGGLFHFLQSLVG